MERSYEVLNDYLNLFCQRHDSPIFRDYLNDYLELSNKTLLMLRDKKFYVPAEREIQSLTLEESLDLCDEFIQTYLEPYYSKWKEFLFNGVVNFTDVQQMDIDGVPRKGNWANIVDGERQVFREVNVELTHSYKDPAFIIHEFVHQLNIDVPENLVNNYVIITFPRMLLTESVSIYFETLMFRFMEEKGLSKEDIAKAQVYRVYDLLQTAGCSIDHLILLRDFENFGRVSENNVDEAKEYGLITFNKKEDYQKVAHEIEDRIVQGQEDLNHMQPSYDFFKDFRYIIGTNLAYWAISQDDPNMPWKFIQFNEDLAHDRDLNYALSRFSTNPVSIKGLIDGTEEEICRCINQITTPTEKRR